MEGRGIAKATGEQNSEESTTGRKFSMFSTERQCFRSYSPGLKAANKKLLLIKVLVILDTVRVHYGPTGRGQFREKENSKVLLLTNGTEQQMMH